MQRHVMLSVYDDYVDLCFYSFLSKFVPRRNNNNCYNNNNDNGKWAATWQNQQSDCAPREDSDQLGHLPSLIRVFAVRLMGS